MHFTVQKVLSQIMCADSIFVADCLFKVRCRHHNNTVSLATRGTHSPSVTSASSSGRPWLLYKGARPLLNDTEEPTGYEVPHCTLWSFPHRYSAFFWWLIWSWAPIRTWHYLFSNRADLMLAESIPYKFSTTVLISNVFPYPWDSHNHQTKGLAFGLPGDNDYSVYLVLTRNDTLFQILSIHYLTLHNNIVR